jgi:hypothetical protein
MSDTMTAGGETVSQPTQGYNVPGRKPGSRMPWEFFMGNASHRLIAFKYGLDHPDNVAYYNNKSLKIIIRETGLGDSSLLGSGTGAQRPPAQGGGQVIPFPARPPLAAPPVQVPAAAGMSLLP